MPRRTPARCGDPGPALLVHRSPDLPLRTRGLGPVRSARAALRRSGSPPI